MRESHDEACGLHVYLVRLINCWWEHRGDNSQMDGCYKAGCGREAQTLMLADRSEARQEVMASDMEINQRGMNLFEGFECLEADLEHGQFSKVDTHLLIFRTSLEDTDPDDIVLPDRFVEVMFGVFERFGDSKAVVILILQILNLVSNGGVYGLTVLWEYDVTGLIDNALQRFGKDVLEDALQILSNFMECSDDDEIRQSFLGRVNLTMIMNTQQYISTVRSVGAWLRSVRCMVECTRLEDAARNALIGITLSVLLEAGQSLIEDASVSAEFCRLVASLRIDGELLVQHGICARLMSYLGSSDNRLVRQAARTIGDLAYEGVFLDGISMDTVMEIFGRFEDGELLRCLFSMALIYVEREPTSVDDFFLNGGVGELAEKCATIPYSCKSEAVLFLELMCCMADASHLEVIAQPIVIDLMYDNMNNEEGGERRSTALFQCLCRIGELADGSELADSLRSLTANFASADFMEGDEWRSLIDQHPYLFGMHSIGKLV